MKETLGWVQIDDRSMLGKDASLRSLRGSRHGHEASLGLPLGRRAHIY